MILPRFFYRLLKYRQTKVFLLVLSVGLLFFFNTPQDRPIVLANSWTLVENTLKNSLLEFGLLPGEGLKSGCDLPPLEPWNKDIRQYFQTVQQVECSKSQKSVLYTQHDRLRFNQTALQELGLASLDLKCFFRYIIYQDSDNYKYGPETPVHDDVTELSAEYNSLYAYCFKPYNAFIRYLMPTGLFSLLRIPTYRNVLIYVPNKNKQARLGPNQFSVVTLIIDAISQMQLKRYLPETLRTLERLGGLVFSKHHKVGHNSFPNVMGLLSGMKGAVFPDNTNRSDFIFIDEEFPTILPSLFEKYGYTSMFMEDYQHLGDFNRKNRIGFKSPPVQIYYRAGFSAMGRHEIGALLNAKTGKSGSYGCLMEDLILNFQLRALKDMMEMYANRPYFAHLHLSEYTHDQLGYLHLYDKALRSMLLSLDESGSLNNTFFLLMGDHGFQRGEHLFTRSDQGRIENNMPAFVLLPPRGFSASFPEEFSNLVNNTAKLTSIFDINQMLRDILVLGNSSAAKEIKSLEGHGSSLFSRLKDRDCNEAEIESRFCSCTNNVIKLNETDNDIIALAQSILDSKARTIVGTGYCQPYRLDRVKSAKLISEGLAKTIEMQLYLKNTGVIFDVSLTYEGHKIKRLEMIRMDWYSSTSTCLPAQLEFIKQYCICP